MIVPADIERRLTRLEKALEECGTSLNGAEIELQESKADHEISMARTRIALRTREGKRMTVQEFDDQALLINEESYYRLMTAEGVVRAERGNMNRLRTQVDIARSLGTGLRAALDTQ